jgi:hypothetical protein
MRFVVPRFVVILVACVGIALTAAGCDPVTERRYVTEGAGVDLFTAQQAQQADLLKQYVDFICQQAGCTGSWSPFIQAGMNDIDSRCDGFLTWLDARRRDREPVLAELAAVTAAVHTIMTVSGATPKSLDILTAAFGVASATYSNWNSRLLLSVNQSTVQEVVYNSQKQYRDTIKDYVVDDLPTAIYLLRNYLRICMPTTIEANINTSSTLVSRGTPASAQKSLVVSTVTGNPPVRVRSTFQSDDAGVALTRYVYPNGIQADRNAAHAKDVSDFLKAQNINAPIQFFLNSGMYATQRTILARQLKLIP